MSRAVKLYVAKQNRPEIKRYVNFLDETTLSTLTGGLNVDLLPISQGSGEYQRVGDQIKVMGVHVRGMFNNNSADVNYVRMLILGAGSDTDPSLFSTAQYFGDANNAGGTASIGTNAGANTLYYPINKTKFHVYYDKLYKLGPNVDVTSAKSVNLFKKFRMPVKYVANTTGAGNNSKQLQLIFLAAQANDDVGTGDTIEGNFHIRTFFTDA